MQRMRANSMLKRSGKPAFPLAIGAIWLACLPLCVAFLLALLPGQPCGAQSAPGTVHAASMPQPIGQRVGDSDPLPGVPHTDNERLLRALNADRQKSLVSDTNKLLRLVNELNAEIARSNTGSLTSVQLHKLAEIEKLAHNVKYKMSTSVRSTPAFQPPFQPVRY
ncbi:MAG: hypothetical protein ACLPY1_02490 [Terracidiphilus sp.]